MLDLGDLAVHIPTQQVGYIQGKYVDDDGNLTYVMQNHWDAGKGSAFGWFQLVAWSWFFKKIEEKE